MRNQTTNEQETGPAAERELAAITQQIQERESLHAETSEKLGDALARMRTGDKKAETEAGRLSLRRAGLDSELRDLTLTQSALRSTVELWRAGESQRTATLALAELESITSEAREVEEQFAAQMTAAVETAKRLDDLYQQWQRTRRGVAQDVSDLQPPRAAGWLFNSETINRPESIGRWLEPIRAVTHTAPRFVTENDPAPESGRFSLPSIVEEMHRKASA